MTPVVSRVSPFLRALAIAGLLALALPGEVAVWVDEDGSAVLTNREPEDEGVERIEPEDLRLRWRGKLLDERPNALDWSQGAGDSGDRSELREAIADVKRGELRSALQSLRRLARGSEVQEEAIWLLARVELHRGRMEPARQALVALRGISSARALDMQAQVDRLIGEIDAELEHARQNPHTDAPRTEESDHYTLVYDHRFAGRDFGERLISNLEQVREELGVSLGATLARPLDVYLYTRAQYLDSYQHRFGFATVGFYDGAIHAVTTRQPRLRLKALLTHEHVHAIFLDAIGSHRPFFLNEGLAEREEERVLGRPRVADEEWRDLVDAQRAGEWLPLSQLVRGFSGLDGRRARLAYLESRAAVELLSRRPGLIARWLARCKRGEPWENALLMESGFDVAGLNEALLQEVRGRFPELPPGLRVGGT